MAAPTVGGGKREPSGAGTSRSGIALSVAPTIASR
jgi:hypothetical protein